MKTFKQKLLAIFTLLSMVCTQSGFSQITGVTPMQYALHAIHSSEYVFEGKIIDQIFFEESPGNPWTANVIKITQIFKGESEINCGNILLIHRGVSGNWVDFGNGLYTTSVGSHVIQFNTGAQGIFFANPNNDFFPEPDDNPTENSLILKNVSEGRGNFLRYSFDPEMLDTISLEQINGVAEGFNGMRFESMEEVYTFILHEYQIDLNALTRCNSLQPDPNNRKGLEFQDWEIKIDDEPKILEHIDDNGFNYIKKQELLKEHEILQEENQSRNQNEEIFQHYQKILNDKLNNTGKFKLTGLSPNLSLSLANESFTGNSTTKYIEFDILISSSEPGTYLDNAIMYFTYNTSAFGANIVSSNKVEVFKGNIFNTQYYMDPNSIMSDRASNELQVSFSADISLPIIMRTEVPSFPTQLLRLKIEIQQCNLNSNIYFTDQAWASNFMIYTENASTPSSGPYYTYTYTNFDGTMNVALCLPRIDNFTNFLRAGVGDILSISGKHFGNSQGNGYVLLRSADAPEFIPLRDAEDYISWTDNEIHVRIPSVVVNIFELPGAGSGNFYVKTNLGDSSISSSPLIIRYSVLTSRRFQLPGPVFEKLRLNLIDDNNQGSYTFHCDTSISNYPIRKAIVAKAIRDWNCLTGVNWQLGHDVINSSYADDGMNVIFMDRNLRGDPVAQTSHHTIKACNTTNQQGYKAYFDEVDIRISVDFAAAPGGPFYWFYDTTGANLPPQHLDFYAVILHELGHAHALGHINDENNPMFYSNFAGPIIGANRRIFIENWNVLEEAGQYVANQSSNISYNCNANSNTPHFPGYCFTATNVQIDHKEVPGIKIFPNPTYDKVFIELEASHIFDIIELYDLKGAKLYSIKTEKSNDFEMFKINLDQLKAGVYLVKLTSAEGTITKRIIKAQ